MASSERMVITITSFSTLKTGRECQKASDLTLMPRSSLKVGPIQWFYQPYALPSAACSGVFEHQACILSQRGH